jgi:fumarylacetoacetase
MPVDATNDPGKKSWVASANIPGGDFPIQNLPLSVFRRRRSAEPFRGGVAIGNEVLDLGLLGAAHLGFDETARAALTRGSHPQLNGLMELGAAAWRALRNALFDGLLEGSRHQTAFERCLVPASEVEYSLPACIGDFTDFYTSIHHATAVGRLFRPDDPLLPNYKWMPIGYHGRSSSIGISGQEIHRPWGQRLPPGNSEPVLSPSVRLDYELELGVFVGNGNPLGTPIAIEDAESHVFGLCLLNDWSARDIQAWEYQPLGPFLGKNFATTVSPWIVSLQALAPFRAPHSRPPGDPAAPGYLRSTANDAAGAIDIRLEVDLETASMRKRGDTPRRLSSTSFRHSFWTVAQLLAHHTINGCNLRAGDLVGTGTQSGPTPEEAGSMLELSAAGKHPIAVGSGEQRAFLEDGDAVTLRGWCERVGAARIGFGEARGLILPPRGLPASRGA